MPGRSWRLGEFEIALEYGIRAIMALEGVAFDPTVAASVHSTLGQIYMGLGQFAEAQRQFSLEEKIIRAPLFSLRDIAVLRGNQGNCYMSQGQLAKAGVGFREQLALVRKTKYSREKGTRPRKLGQLPQGTSTFLACEGVLPIGNE